MSSILCVGELLFDRLESEPTTTRATNPSWQRFPGGAPANVATALVKLGTSAALITRVGRDAAGDELAALMQQVGVETRGLQRDAKRPTRQVDVLRDAHGDRHFGGFGGQATSDFADTALTSTVIPADLFGSAEALVFGTITLAFAESRAALEHCLTLATQQGLRRVLDLNWRPMFWPDPTLAVDRIAALLPQVDLLKLAAAEAALFFKTTDPGAIARQWPLLRLVLVTDGAQGCHWWSQGEVGFTPAFTVTAVDTTGAGDSFLAAVLHQITQRGLGCLAEAKSVREIVRYASAAGALTTLQAGAIAAQPSAAEVDAFLQQP